MKRIGFVAGLALALSGCTADYAQQSNADVLLIVAQVNPTVVQSDVSLPTPDSATLLVANRSKNPNVTNINVPSHVILERYEVRYYRSDGRNTQGVDVPYTISGNLTINVDVATSGGTEVPVEIVRAQAKLEPPLRNLRSVAGDFGGSALVLTCFAEITIHGRTISGQAVSASGRVQVDFADWPTT